MRFYTTTQLGPKQHLTPEGFLVCEDVPLARVGTYIYGPNETPIAAGPDGITRIERDPEEVFRPETIASFIGKPLVDDHPEDGDVTPENWRRLAMGHIIDPRRGVGTNDDVLIGDLMVTDPEAIKLIRDEGKRELSCGYDADYMETGPGRGRQTNIVGNHVALVDTGRCGPRCAIGDSNKEVTIVTKTLGQRILDAFRKKDEGALTAVLDELPDDEQPTTNSTHVHIHTRDKDDEEEDDKKKTKDKDDDDDDKSAKFKDSIDARFAAQDTKIAGIARDVKAIKDAVTKEDDDEDKTKDEGALAFQAEAPPGTGDRAWTKDSAYMEESFQETVAFAEIIAPGIGLPTFDAASKPRKTYDAMCRLRRQALDIAYNQPESRSFMDELMNGRELKAYTCDGVRTMFRAVGIFSKRKNKDDMRRESSDVVVGGGTGVKGIIKTPAELNKKMAEFYASR